MTTTEETGPDPLTAGERRAVLREHLEREKSRRHDAEAKLAQANELIGQLQRITTAWTRGMYAAQIDCWRGDPKAAAATLSEGLDGYDGPGWDGTETGAEWWERTKAEEGL